MLVSDNMLCAAESYLSQKYNMENQTMQDLIFTSYVDGGKEKIDILFDEFVTDHKRLCDRDIEWRGDNNMTFASVHIPTPKHASSMPWRIVNKPSISEQKCSFWVEPEHKQHLLFNNVTKF